MNKRKINITLGWVMLVFIGISVTFSTLHSHHHLEWNHTDSHVDTGHCLVDGTNVCPVCGYLFSADVADRQPQSLQLTVRAFVIDTTPSQQFDSFLGLLTGRSPPAII